MHSVFGASSLHNAPLTSNLTEEQRKQLCGLLGNVELTLLYKASVHGYQASAFHQRCDRQGPTLLVAYNRSGYIFGGYTSVDYTQSGQYITDEDTFLFSFQGKIPVCIKINTGHYARIDDTGVPSFGQQLYFCYNNQAVVYNSGSSAFSLTGTMYGNDTQLSECEVYKVEQILRRSLGGIFCGQLSMFLLSRVRILMIGPVGAGKSSFFNSINSIFMGRITSKAILTTQFRTYPVRDGREGKTLPFVLCDTMGLEEQSGAGLDIEDISSILQGHVPDRYKFNPTAPFQPHEQKASRPASLKEKIHCVVYVIDATKISLMSDKLQEKLASIRRKVNSLVEENLQRLYVSSYIKSKVSSRLGVPVSCVLPVKNYSQELELELNCDVLLLTALQQMLNFADDYLDDVGHVEDKDF
ncbi:hypothetical protein M9458_044089 [Cirrhinus mrigala]|uniref:TLDc domain-containing protein n=1 Tax=Cirrhinus mrigala TaxID=683832 RepID=A0ABD0NED3_CIRMR